jgi:hypothetical protein
MPFPAMNVTPEFGPVLSSVFDLNDSVGKCSAHLAHSQSFPQLHSLLSFMGQFLPLFLQFGLSAAKVTVQIAAARIENRTFVLFFIRLISFATLADANGK